MESNVNNRGGLLSAGGVLLIIAGIFQVISAVSLVVSIVFPRWFMYLVLYGSRLVFVPGFAGSLETTIQFYRYGNLEGIGPMLFAVSAGVLAIVAIVGGISAIRRKRFGLSLAGAICAVPFGSWGILAIVFVVLGKREFGGEGLSGI